MFTFSNNPASTVESELSYPGAMSGFYNLFFNVNANADYMNNH